MSNEIYKRAITKIIFVKAKQSLILSELVGNRKQ